ncbi:MAG: hypothetical protein BIFFINMI_00619 [Phycisphaerae bacterium]|nr:hypothetical protein [Phycisphaerae bacterium]
MRFAFDQTALPGSDFDEQLRYAVESEADGIGLCWLHAAEAQRINDRTAAQKMLRSAQEAGIAVPNLALKCLLDRPSLLGCPAEHAEAKEVLARGLAFAAVLDIGTVVLPFVGGTRMEIDTELEKAAECFAVGSELADRYGIKLAVRCALDPGNLRYLLAGCRRPEVIEVCLDVADAAAVGLDPAAIIREMGGSRIAQICVRDVLRSLGEPPDFSIRLGRGMVDFAAVRQALSDVGFDGWVIVDTPPGDPAGQIACMNMADARQLLRPDAIKAPAATSGVPDTVGQNR